MPVWPDVVTQDRTRRCGCVAVGSGCSPGVRLGTLVPRWSCASRTDSAAVSHQAPVVTSDPGDLTRIADSIGVKIRLFPT